MRLVLDGKSAAVGVFAGAALVAGIGAARADKPEPQVGRFLVEAAGSNAATTAYVVDTVTGQVWREFNDAGFHDRKLDAGD